MYARSERSERSSKEANEVSSLGWHDVCDSKQRDSLFANTRSVCAATKERSPLSELCERPEFSGRSGKGLGADFPWTSNRGSLEC